MMQNKLTEILDKLKRVIDGANNELFMVKKPYCKILTDKERVIKSTINSINYTIMSNDIKKIFELDDINIDKIKSRLDELSKKCEQENADDITEKDILDIYQELAKLKIMVLVNNAINSNHIISLFIVKKFDESGGLIAESKHGKMLYFDESRHNSRDLYLFNKLFFNNKDQERDAISNIDDTNIILDCSSSNYDLHSLTRKLNNGTFIENGIKIDCSKNLCFSLNALLETLLDSEINVAVIEYSARDVNKSISQSGIKKFINLYNYRREKEDKYKHLTLKEEKIKNPKVHRGIRIIKNGENFNRTAQFIHIKLSDLERYRNNTKKYKSILFDEINNKKMYEIFSLITGFIINRNTKIIDKFVYKVFEFYYFLAESINDDRVHSKLNDELNVIINQYTVNDEIKQRIIKNNTNAITDSALINKLRQVKLKGLPYIHVNEGVVKYKDSYNRIKKMIIDNGLLMGVGGIAVEKNDIDNLLNKINSRIKKEDMLKAAKLYKISGKSYHYFNADSIKYIQNKLGVKDVTFSNISEFIISGNIQLQHFTANDNELFREIIHKSCELMDNSRYLAISLSDTLINKKGKINDVNNELLEKYGNNYGSLINYLTGKRDKIDSREDIAVITIFNTLNIQQSIKDTQFDTLLELIKKVVKND
jgi:hypothetical protein